MPGLAIAVTGRSPVLDPCTKPNCLKGVWWGPHMVQHKLDMSVKLPVAFPTCFWYSRFLNPESVILFAVLTLHSLRQLGVCYTYHTWDIFSLHFKHHVYKTRLLVLMVVPPFVQLIDRWIARCQKQNKNTCAMPMIHKRLLPDGQELPS